MPARKTAALGKVERTKASTPRAHPTRTEADENSAARRGTKREAADDPCREPQNEKDEKRDRIETMETNIE